jgi:hypothetical protein
MSQALLGLFLFCPLESGVIGAKRHEYHGGVQTGRHTELESIDHYKTASRTVLPTYLSTPINDPDISAMPTAHNKIRYVDCFCSRARHSAAALSVSHTTLSSFIKAIPTRLRLRLRLRLRKRQTGTETDQYSAIYLYIQLRRRVIKTLPRTEDGQGKVFPIARTRELFLYPVLSCPGKTDKFDGRGRGRGRLLVHLLGTPSNFQLRESRFVSSFSPTLR